MSRRWNVTAAAVTWKRLLRELTDAAAGRERLVLPYNVSGREAVAPKGERPFGAYKTG